MTWASTTPAGNHIVDGLTIGGSSVDSVVSNNWLGDTVTKGSAPSRTLTATGTVATGAGNYLDGTWA